MKEFLNLTDKTILITGARGFLGRYFIETFNLLNEKYLVKPVKIIALDNLITSGKSGIDFPEYENVARTFDLEYFLFSNMKTDEKITQYYG